MKTAIIWVFLTMPSLALAGSLRQSWQWIEIKSIGDHWTSESGPAEVSFTGATLGASLYFEGSPRNKHIVIVANKTPQKGNDKKVLLGASHNDIDSLTASVTVEASDYYDFPMKGTYTQYHFDSNKTREIIMITDGINTIGLTRGD
jgi:hypothetical protein